MKGTIISASSLSFQNVEYSDIKIIPKSE